MPWRIGKDFPQNLITTKCKINANNLGLLKPQEPQHADFSGAAAEPLAESGLLILIVWG